MSDQELRPDGGHPGDAEHAYDYAYAKSYGSRWWKTDHFAADDAYYRTLIGSYVNESTRWLDVGCGTGHFMSYFPDVPRAGIDISDSMLRVARVANPNALEFRAGDVLEPHAPWDGAWDVVTCTGEPWSYLPTLDHFEKWVDQMAAWTSAEGTCINQTPDIQELAFTPVAYNFTGDRPPPGTVSLLGIMWDMSEVDIEHGTMIWPSLDLWVRWFGRHFRRVEVIHPDPGTGVIFGRVVVASQKRVPGDNVRTTVIYEPPLGSLPEGPRGAPPPEPFYEHRSSPDEVGESFDAADSVPLDEFQMVDGVDESHHDMVPVIEPHRNGPIAAEEFGLARRQHLWLALPIRVRRTLAGVYWRMPRLLRTPVSRRFNRRPRPEE